MVVLKTCDLFISKLHRWFALNLNVCEIRINLKLLYVILDNFPCKCFYAMEMLISVKAKFRHFLNVGRGGGGPHSY